MLIQKKSSIKGEWAKAGEDIRDGDVVVFMNEGEIDTTGTFGPRHVFSLKTRNGEKNLGLNQTSVNNMVDAYGQETSQWVGKKAKCWVMKMMIDGSLRNVAYLSHPDAVMDDEGRFALVKPQEDPGYADEPAF